MRGSSLPELLVTLAVIGLATAMATLRLATFGDRFAVEAATADLLVAYQRARLTALGTAQPVRFEFAAPRATAWSLGTTDSSLAWTIPGPAARGVTLVESPGPVVMTPAGVTMGVANGRYVLERGDIRRTVVASRLGRLRVSRPRGRRGPTRRAGSDSAGPSGSGSIGQCPGVAPPGACCRGCAGARPGSAPARLPPG